jgi:flavodoxin
MTHALIVYHSLYGNTKAVAEYIVKGMQESEIEFKCLVDVGCLRWNPPLEYNLWRTGN